MQAAFKEHHGLQCGFCTPGMVMSAVDLVKKKPNASEHEIREWLEGNNCRCTGYNNIVKAIQHAQQTMLPPPIITQKQRRRGPTGRDVKSVVKGKRVSVRVDIGGRSIF